MKAWYLLLLLVLGSCSARWHVRQAKKHEALAVAKGAIIALDTVYKEIIREIPVKGSDSNIPVTPVVDTTGFSFVMNMNDSLVRVIDAFEKEIASGNSLDQERAIGELKRANTQINALKKKLSKRYLQDSTYRYKADSITIVYFTIDEGVISDVGYVRQDTTIPFVDTVPIEIRKIFNAGYSQKQVLIAGILGLLAVLIIGFAIGYKSGKT